MTRGPPSPDCIIKGNRRKDECIYHVPGDRLYGRLKMNGAGKRWFCSERPSKSGRVPTCAVAWGSALLLFDGRRGANDN